MVSTAQSIKTRKNTYALEWRRCKDLTFLSSADMFSNYR